MTCQNIDIQVVSFYFNVSFISEYPGNVSVWHLRFFPAFLSALTVPVIYEIMVELRTARWTATLAAALFILGNSNTIILSGCERESLIVN